jgi:hypothetical protein
MEKDKEKLVSDDTKCSSHQAVEGYIGHIEIPDIGFDKSISSDTKLVKVVCNAKSKSPCAFILSPLSANTVNSQLMSPNVLCNTSNLSICVTEPYHTDSNSRSSCNVNQRSESCNAADVSPDLIVSSDPDCKKASVEKQDSRVLQGTAIHIVTALLQNGISPGQSENDEFWPSEIQKIISRISCFVDQIFATSKGGILVTFPCTPGFEKAKVGPADRSTVKCGSVSSFGLTDECVLEKKFNVLFHHFSTGLLSNVSTESEIKKFICYAMNDLMEVLPVEYALSLVCNCSLCWFLYMCAKVICRDSPEETCKLNWSGCSISSYRCLAMRRICITDMNSKTDDVQDSNVNQSFTLPLRFTRGGKKRKLLNQKEFKPRKRNMILHDLDLSKVSKTTVKKCESAVVPSCSFSRIKPDCSVKNTALGSEGCPRFQSPEEDAYVFNPVRQFKGNTYTRQKNSGVR